MKPIFGSRATQEVVLDSPESLQRFERSMRLRVADPEPPLTDEERKRLAGCFVEGLRRFAEDYEHERTE